MRLSQAEAWFWPTPAAQAAGPDVCDRCGRRLGGAPPLPGREQAWRHPRHENPYTERPLPGGAGVGSTCALCYEEDVLRRMGRPGAGADPAERWGPDVVDRAAIADGVRGTVTDLHYWEDPRFLGTHARVRFVVTVGVDGAGRTVAVPINLGLSPALARGLLYDGDVVEIRGFDEHGGIVRTASVTNLKTGASVDNWSPDDHLDRFFRQSTRPRANADGG